MGEVRTMRPDSPSLASFCVHPDADQQNTNKQGDQNVGEQRQVLQADWSDAKWLTKQWQWCKNSIVEADRHLQRIGSAAHSDETSVGQNGTYNPIVQVDRYLQRIGSAVMGKRSKGGDDAQGENAERDGNRMKALPCGTGMGDTRESAALGAMSPEDRAAALAAMSPEGQSHRTSCREDNVAGQVDDALSAVDTRENRSTHATRQPSPARI